MALQTLHIKDSSGEYAPALSEYVKKKPLTFFVDTEGIGSSVGMFDEKNIDAMPMDAWMIDHITGTMHRIGDQLGISIQRVNSPDSNIDFHLVGSDPSGDEAITGRTYLGVTAEQIRVPRSLGAPKNGKKARKRSGRRSSKKQWISRPEADIALVDVLANDTVENKKHIISHEIGHAFGLEHPFESKDGDVYTDPVFVSESIMAYRKQPENTYPDYFTQIDQQALFEIFS